MSFSPVLIGWKGLYGHRCDFWVDWDVCECDPSLVSLIHPSLGSHISQFRHFTHTSSSFPVTAGVPQCSASVPHLFTISILPLRHFFWKYNINTQIYASSKPSSFLPPTSLSDCLQEITSWFSFNFIKHNGNRRSSTYWHGLHSNQIMSFSINIDSSLIFSWCHPWSFQAHINNIILLTFTSKTSSDCCSDQNQHLFHRTHHSCPLTALLAVSKEQI